MRDDTNRKCPSCKSKGNFFVWETHDQTGCVEIRDGKVVGRNWEASQPTKITFYVKCLSCGHTYTPKGGFNWSDFPDGETAGDGWVDSSLNGKEVE